MSTPEEEAARAKAHELYEAHRARWTPEKANCWDPPHFKQHDHMPLCFELQNRAAEIVRLKATLVRLRDLLTTINKTDSDYEIGDAVSEGWSCIDASLASSTGDGT